MTQVTGPLTINDGAATPVAKSFAPLRIAPELSIFTERSAVIPAGYPKLSVALDAASSKRATNRVDISLSLPVVQTVNGLPTVTKTGLFKGYFVVPDTFEAADRANLHAYVANALQNAQLKAVIKDLDPLY